MDAYPVYPTQRKPLKAEIDRLLAKAASPPEPGLIHALVVPYSNRLEGGPLAARIYRHVEGLSYHTVIVIAPSRSGAFRRITVCSVDSYGSPLGDLPVNTRVRDELCDEDDDIFIDDTGHFQPTGVDVQLPFLQTVIGDFEIVPIVMGNESPDFCRELGHAVGEVMYNRPTLLVACVDVKGGESEDLKVLEEAFEAGDETRLMRLMNSGEVDVHGSGALLVALIAAKHRRADAFRVVELEPPLGDVPGRFGAVLSFG